MMPYDILYCTEILSACQLVPQINQYAGKVRPTATLDIITFTRQIL